jgi:glycosyltransferase involved in cell wall biosynthesis
MYRAVTDLARTLGSPIVTFRDGTGREPPGITDVPIVTIDWSEYALVRRAVLPPQRVLQAVAAAIRDADCLVVHSLFRCHAQIVHEIATARGIPYLIVPHGALEPGLWETKRLLRNAWLLAGGTAFLGDAARIVFATTGERVHAEATLARPLQAAVIPFAVSLVHHEPLVATHAAARARLGLPGGRRLLLVLGRLDPVKRPREIVAWFCAADPAGCDLVIAGMDGAIAAKDLQKAAPDRFRDRIWFLGPLDATRRDEAVAACDGYLSWSQHESFGYAAVESLAAGLPVILSPGHCLRPELEQVGCGLFPAADSRESFVAAVQQFAGWSAAERFARGEAGRHWVARHLQPETVAAAWLQLIREVTRGGTNA